MQTYVRWELHENSENGTWRRIATSKADNYQEAKAELMTTYHKIMHLSNTPSLEWMIGELARRPIRPLRIAKCTVEVLGEVKP